MKYFLHLAYNGSNYRGWQRQPNVITVQEVLEDALSKMLKTTTHCSGCGRTDAEVHASQYFAHIKTDQELENKHVYYLNKMLPPDIVVYEIFSVDFSAHAQKDAVARTYDYFIHFHKDAILHNQSSLCEYSELNVENMQAACKLFLSLTDFRALCKRPDQHNSTICDLMAASITQNKDKTRLRYRVTSNRFLQGMIRQMVGRLLQVGRGEISLPELKQILESGQEIPSKLAAPPQGLFLSKISYPYLDIENKSSFYNQINKGFK